MKCKIIDSLSILGAFTMSLQQKPNIVFLIADEINYGDLSYFGQEKFYTTIIDKLALSRTED